MGRRAATHSGKPSSRRLDSKSQQTAASELTTQYPANLMSGFTATEGDRKTDGGFKRLLQQELFDRFDRLLEG